MGHVTAHPAALTVGKPDLDSEGRIRGWESSPYWTIGFADSAESGAAASWERLALAVAKASSRFMNIDEDGNHLPDDQLGYGAFTPRYVSDPNLTPSGVSVSADTGGYLTVAMGMAMVRVLVEELGRLPFDTHVSRHQQGSAEVIWRTPYLPRGEPTVIARAVRCVVDKGVPDVIAEYLDTEGGWTVLLADARVFERDERGTDGETWEAARRLTLSMLEGA
jgi:hypothetical protein